MEAGETSPNQLPLLISSVIPSFDQSMSQWLTDHPVSVARYGTSRPTPVMYRVLSAVSGHHSPERVTANGVTIGSLGDIPSGQLLEYLGMSYVDTYTKPRQNFKDGGRVIFTEKGLVVNVAERRAQDLWVTLATGVPDSRELLLQGTTENKTYISVAPVLVNKHGRVRRTHATSDNGRAFSRFCGLNVSELTHQLDKAKATIQNTSYNESSKQRLSQCIEKFTTEVTAKMDKILSELERMGFDHAVGVGPVHTHTRNFTVEFTRKEAYHTQMAEGTINTAFDPQDTHFDLKTYFLHPDEYEVVVRLIDFDHLGFDPRKALEGIEMMDKHRVINLLHSQSVYKKMVALAAIERVPMEMDDRLMLTALDAVMETAFTAWLVNQGQDRLTSLSPRVCERLYELILEHNVVAQDYILAMAEGHQWPDGMTGRIKYALDRELLGIRDVLYMIGGNDELERKFELLTQASKSSDHSDLTEAVYWVGERINADAAAERVLVPLPHQDFLIKTALSRNDRAAERAFTLLEQYFNPENTELIMFAKQLSRQIKPTTQLWRHAKWGNYGLAHEWVLEKAVKFIARVPESWVDEWIAASLKSKDKGLSHLVVNVKKYREKNK